MRCIWAAAALCRGEWATPGCTSYRLPTWCDSLPWLEWLLPAGEHGQVSVLAEDRRRTARESEKERGGVPVHKNTVLVQSFWGPYRSCRRSSSNIKSALRRRRRSPCRCPSCPSPGRAERAWSTLLTSTAAEDVGRWGRRRSQTGLDRRREGRLTWHRSAWTEVSWFVFICILSIACFRMTTPLKGCRRRRQTDSIKLNSVHL